MEGKCLQHFSRLSRITEEKQTIYRKYFSRILFQVSYETNTIRIFVFLFSCNNRTNGIYRGSFSIVREAVHIPSGTVVAVKSISKRFISKKGWANLCREIEIMVTVNHPNVLKMHEYIDTPNNVHLILE